MINYLAILVAAIGAFLVGMLWFTVLFGKKWRALMNVPGDASMQGMGKSMAGGFVATLILVAAMEYLFALNYIMTLPTALVLTFIWWLMIAAVMSNMIWYEKKPVALYLINVFHYFFAMGVATLIISCWW